MSYHSRSSVEFELNPFWILLWAIAPSIATIVIVAIGFSVSSDGRSVLIAAVLVSFALAYSWSAHLMSRSSLSSPARAFLAIPLALVLLVLNTIVAMLGCTLVLSSATGIAPSAILELIGGVGLP